tara:strand:+ start:126 stop:821 length:696 start_codon:yes stop_codon:yes gene_type:complete
MVTFCGNIAIILARGGSKRIPFKNIIEFGGKPMIAWTIEAALSSKMFEKVLVSTDNEDIKNISIKFGAEVPFLRTDAFDDITSSSEATLFALNQAEKYWNTTFNTVTQLMANCPLRNFSDIRNSIDSFYKLKRSSQISCFKFGWMNPWWSLKKTSEGNYEPLFPNSLSQRSQDLPELYCPTGAIWVSKVDYLRTYKTFYSIGHTFEEINWKSAIDIDDYNDLNMAKTFLNL